MKRVNNRLTRIELRSRTKGKNVFPVSISLTQEQIDWLKKQPNASELIRSLLDDLIRAGAEVEAKAEVISLNNQVKQLREQREKLCNQKNVYINENKSFWKTFTRLDWVFSEIKFDETEGSELRTPKISDEYVNNKSAQYAMRVVKGYNDTIRAINQKIEAIEAQVLQSQ